MSRVAIVLCFLFVVSPLFGQHKGKSSATKPLMTQQCQLTRAPELRGFALGQSIDELDKRLPGIREEFNQAKDNDDGDITRTDWTGPWTKRLKWKDVGVVYLSGYFDESSQFIIDDFSGAPRKISFSGDTDDLHKIVFWFSEERLYGFSLYYLDYAPKTARDFAKQLSEKLDLPPKAWKAMDKADIGSVLQCVGFKVNVSIAYRDDSHVTVTDTNTENRIMASEQAIKEQRRREEQERIRRERQRINTLKP